MKVKEIEINGKIYCINHITESDKYSPCNYCDLSSHCDNTKENDVVFEVCRRNPSNSYFKEIKQKENTNIKFYRFSSGTIFNVNYIKDILFITFVEKYSPEHYGFTIILNQGNVEVGFKNTIAANRERNKFIKFIEKYGYTNSSI